MGRNLGRNIAVPYAPDNEENFDITGEDLPGLEEARRILRRIFEFK
jgi:hypothetical protein